MTIPIPTLTISDLNTAVHHEPRLRDLTIAERLGFDQARDIRKLIERNRAELETYGDICATVAQKTDPKGRGRPSKEYWLNEGQTLVLCALSRTSLAAAIRKEVIEVYMAHRTQLALPAPKASLPPFCTDCAARQEWDNPQPLYPGDSRDPHCHHPLRNSALTKWELAAIGMQRGHNDHAVEQAIMAERERQKAKILEALG